MRNASIRGCPLGDDSSGRSRRRPAPSSSHADVAASSARSPLNNWVLHPPPSPCTAMVRTGEILNRCDAWPAGARADRDARCIAWIASRVGSSTRLQCECAALFWLATERPIGRRQGAASPTANPSRGRETVPASRPTAPSLVWQVAADLANPGSAAALGARGCRFTAPAQPRWARPSPHGCQRPFRRASRIGNSDSPVPRNTAEVNDFGCHATP